MTELLWGHAPIQTISNSSCLLSHDHCLDSRFPGNETWDVYFYCLPNWKDTLSIMRRCVNLNFLMIVVQSFLGARMVSTLLPYSMPASFRLATIMRIYFSGSRYFLATRRTSSRVMDRIRGGYFSG